MRTVFADTFYFLAIFNRDDAGHERTLAMSAAMRGVHLLTTSWVVTEFADATCSRRLRRRAAAFIRHLAEQPDLTIIPADEDLFDAGLSLYEARSDKDWSLTDCVSFVVMEREGLSEALTGDRHFAQAGFRPLLD